MPKDYFEVVEEPEEVISEAERQAKVIEFVYQVPVLSAVQYSKIQCSTVQYNIVLSLVKRYL